MGHGITLSAFSTTILSLYSDVYLRRKKLCSNCSERASGKAIIILKANNIYFMPNLDVKFFLLFIEEHSIHRLVATVSGLLKHLLESWRISNREAKGTRKKPDGSVREISIIYFTWILFWNIFLRVPDPLSRGSHWAKGAMSKRVKVFCPWITWENTEKCF